jgi:hypothetical protein
MILFRSRGALYGECWFEEPPTEAGVDVLALRQRASPLVGARCQPFFTMFNDLTVGDDEVMERFGANCREKIRRADRRDDLELEILEDPYDQLAAFAACYDAFAAQRKLRRANLQWLKGACAARQLKLARVSRKGETLTWNAYVVSGRDAWFQHGVSRFRDLPEEQRAVAARANRWLHWRSMLWFREQGYERYDWGGLFEREATAEQAGINRFKREFGGREVRSFDCYVPLTFKGHLRLGLNRLGDAARAVRTRAQSLGAGASTAGSAARPA